MSAPVNGWRHGLLLGLGLALLAQYTMLGVGTTPARADPSAPRRNRQSVGRDDLDRIIHPVMTITQMPDGRRQLTVGNGFVVGNRYFTVSHNLGSKPLVPEHMRTIYLEGTPIIPSYADFELDVAVFVLPPALCRRYCNDLVFGQTPELEQDRKVYWLRKIDGKRMWKEGRVRNYTLMDDGPTPRDAAGTGCAGNLVVEVDTPFPSGTSGGPVLDAATGHIIGIIQGSMLRDGSESGYFKPINCLSPFAEALAPTQE